MRWSSTIARDAKPRGGVADLLRQSGVLDAELSKMSRCLREALFASGSRPNGVERDVVEPAADAQRTNMRALP
jgi:hypothetical protein